MVFCVTICDCFEIIPTYLKKTSLSLTYFGTIPFLNIFYFKPYYLFKIIFPSCKRCLELLSLYLTFFQDEFRLFLLKNFCSFCTAILFPPLVVYRLIYSWYRHQSNCRIAHMWWMSINYKYN